MLIELKRIYSRKVLFSHRQENNTLYLTLKTAIESGVNLTSVDLYKADLKYANLTNANLMFADLQSADLRYATLERTKLGGANLTNANLISADLHYANLNSANLQGANLYKTNFYHSNLISADLRGANLNCTDFRNADLRYSFIPADRLKTAQLSNCVGNGKSIFSMQLEQHPIVFTKNTLCIGCRQYSIEEWRNFSDEDIQGLDINALNFWKKWKELIFTAIAIKFNL